MSQQNVEAFLRLAEALNGGKVEEALGDIAEDVVVVGLRSEVEGEYRGHDGVRRFFSDNAETFDAFRLDYGEAEALEAAGLNR